MTLLHSYKLSCLSVPLLTHWLCIIDQPDESLLCVQSSQSHLPLSAGLTNSCGSEVAWGRQNFWTMDVFLTVECVLLCRSRNYCRIEQHRLQQRGYGFHRGHSAVSSTSARTIATQARNALMAGNAAAAAQAIQSALCNPVTATATAEAFAEVITSSVGCNGTVQSALTSKKPLVLAL